MCVSVSASPADHMYIEEYIEEDEEPPLLLSSRPSHGKYVCLCGTYITSVRTLTRDAANAP